jgi:hypothetical protein
MILCIKHYDLINKIQDKLLLFGLKLGITQRGLGLWLTRAKISVDVRSILIEDADATWS